GRVIEVFENGVWQKAVVIKTGINYNASDDTTTPTSTTTDSNTTSPSNSSTSITSDDASGQQTYSTSTLYRFGTSLPPDIEEDHKGVINQDCVMVSLLNVTKKEKKLVVSMDRIRVHSELM